MSISAITPSKNLNWTPPSVFAIYGASYKPTIPDWHTFPRVGLKGIIEPKCALPSPDIPTTEKRQSLQGTDGQQEASKELSSIKFIYMKGYRKTHAISHPKILSHLICLSSQWVLQCERKVKHLFRIDITDL